MCGTLEDYEAENSKHQMARILRGKHLGGRTFGDVEGLVCELGMKLSLCKRPLATEIASTKDFCERDVCAEDSWATTTIIGRYIEILLRDIS